MASPQSCVLAASSLRLGTPPSPETQGTRTRNYLQSRVEAVLERRRHHRRKAMETMRFLSCKTIRPCARKRCDVGDLSLDGGELAPLRAKSRVWIWGQRGHPLYRVLQAHPEYPRNDRCVPARASYETTASLKKP